jgi:hypothetical protein
VGGEVNFFLNVAKVVFHFVKFNFGPGHFTFNLRMQANGKTKNKRGQKTFMHEDF